MNALLRRRMMMDLSIGSAGMNIKTGEFVGAGTASVTINHGLGMEPFIFAMIADGDYDTSIQGTLACMFMNTKTSTRYTSTVFKNYFDVGATVNTANDSVMTVTSPYSAVYGIASVTEDTITVQQYGNNNKFIDGKAYRWIAMTDWRT